MNRKELHCNSNNNQNLGQVIDFSELDGPSHMAADEMMLQQLNQQNDLSLSIRFYKWEGEWLSIGKNQKKIPRHWFNLAKKSEINIVRRPSGGSAVLHSGGLTYSMAWRSPPSKKHQAYKEASQWLIEAFYQLGLPLNFGNNPQNFSSENCFATASSADLIDSEGIKRIGSAQLWKKGNVLQHGEILLDPPKELWRKLFNTEPPNPAPTNIPRKGLDEFLKMSIMSHWSKLQWNTKKLQPKDLIKISKYSKNYLLNLSNSDF